jgi:LacI family transcriptional regulator
MTGSDLMAATGINRSTVHEICNDLIGFGWIRELDPRRPTGESRRGRRARVYEFDADAGRVLGIEMGVSQVTACVADLRGNCLAEVVEPLPRPVVPVQERLAAVHKAIDRALASARVQPAHVLAVGLGVPTPVDAGGRPVGGEELVPGLAGMDLQPALARGFGWPIVVGNDASLAALAERWRGAAIQSDDFIVLLAGERIGSGIFVGGRPVRGHGGLAGELRFLDRMEPGAEAVDDLADRMAHAIAAMAAVLDPELVVIGGAAAGDLLVERIKDRLLPELIDAPPRLVASGLGEAAVALGGVRLALDFVESRRFEPSGEAGGTATVTHGRRAGGPPAPPDDQAVDQREPPTYPAETIRHSTSAGGIDRRPGIKDVAALAGVSPSTVSVVLNDVHGARVADDTRRRVFTAAEQLGYAPDALARGLRTRRSHLIGFVSDDIATTPHAGQMIQGAQDMAWKSGLLIVLVSTGGDVGLEEHALSALLQRRIDGVLYATMWHRVVDLPRLGRDLPLVLLDARPSEGSPGAGSTPFVVPDEVGGAASAVTELLDHGHRRIGLATLASPGAATDGRMSGYRRTLAGAGIGFDPALVEFEQTDTLGGYHAVRRLLDLPDPPTGVFCFNDEMATGAYRAAAERGLRIPEELSVVGYDDHALIAASLTPGLTTVALPHYDMGALAMELLLGLTGDLPTSERPTQVHLRCPLVRRGSVGPPRTRPLDGP